MRKKHPFWLLPVIVFAAMFWGGSLAALQMSRELFPSHFRLHLKPGSWKRVDFGSNQDLPIVVPDSASDQWAVSEPIYYGDHGFEVDFKDGRSAYFRYYVTDAGWVGDVNIDLTAYKGTSRMHVGCITSRRPAILRGVHDDTSCDVDLDKATADKPWCLAGV